MYRNSKRYQPVKSPKWPFVLLAVVVLLLLGAGGFVVLHRSNTTAKNNGGVSQTPKTSAPSFDKTKFSLTDPTSIWVVVNKQRPLDPKTYAPSDLQTPASMAAEAGEQVNSQTAAALDAMDAAAKADGIHLILASGYRSYSTQVTTYNSVVNAYGQAEADTQSARPGYSEHQTGFAADLGAVNGKCRIQACFADTPEGQWLAANSWKYGFIIRYTKEKEAVTGYEDEPWHVRYIGVDLATEMHKTGVKTLEEFFNLPAAPNY